jgi:pyrroline-5-carboxylate reductase
MEKIGIIGFGNMGSALAAGLASTNYEVAVSETNQDRAELALKKYGLKVFTEKLDLISFAEILVIAVKPQELDSLIEELGTGNLKGRVKGKLGISIIAGRTIESIMSRLEFEAVARFMPNLAARVGKAAVGIAFSSGAREEFKKDCLNIASALGTPFELPENLMAAVTGLSGSGIAYVFSFLNAMALGGVKTGIPYPKALDIALSTVEGAVEVIRKSGENPTDWLNRVISPAGTTIQGVTALEENAFTYGVIRAVERAAERAAELEH